MNKPDLHENVKAELVSIIDEMHQEISSLQKAGMGLLKQLETEEKHSSRLRRKLEKLDV